RGVERIASVDIGTNSTRWLIADVEGGHVTEIERRTQVSRLGQGVDSSGRLARTAIERGMLPPAVYVDVLDRNSAGREMRIALDSGGGSTEVVAGDPGEPPRFHVSTRAGSVRQTERHLDDDPPRAEQLHSLGEEVRRILEEGVPAETRDAIERGIAVAGTATSL